MQHWHWKPFRKAFGRLSGVFRWRMISNIQKIDAVSKNLQMNMQIRLYMGQNVGNTTVLRCAGAINCIIQQNLTFIKSSRKKNPRNMSNISFSNEKGWETVDDIPDKKNKQDIDCSGIENADEKKKQLGYSGLSSIFDSRRLMTRNRTRSYIPPLPIPKEGFFAALPVENNNVKLILSGLDKAPTLMRKVVLERNSYTENYDTLWNIVNKAGIIAVQIHSFNILFNWEMKILQKEKFQNFDLYAWYSIDSESESLLLNFLPHKTSARGNELREEVLKYICNVTYQLCLTVLKKYGVHIPKQYDRLETLDISTLNNLICSNDNFLQIDCPIPEKNAINFIVSFRNYLAHVSPDFAMNNNLYEHYGKKIKSHLNCILRARDPDIMMKIEKYMDKKSVMENGCKD